VVLPGIVAAFLVTGVIAALPMMLGAGAAALVAVGLIEVIRRLGKIEPGAAMGVVFTAMFAGGVLLLEQSDTSDVHLDVQHALYGNLESLIWLDAFGWSSLFDWEALKGLPPELPRMAATLAFVSGFTWVFWRPLKISSFDEGFARTVGLPTGILGLSLVVVAAIAAVAAFDAVGSIIVIAMFICPPAAARLMTNRLEVQVAWSVGFAVISAVLGYVLAGYGPLWLGFDDAVSAAGMIATVSGVILALAALFGPERAPMGAPAEG
jgi:manganese/zinc/iron transport system permease protein